jgi:hypothetical protein
MQVFLTLNVELELSERLKLPLQNSKYVFNTYTNLPKKINSLKNCQNKKNLRQVVIECLLVFCQPSIAGFLERGNTPWLQWICTICPNPVTIRKKGIMLFIEASGLESECVVDTPGMSKRIIHNQEVVGHNDRLELN